MRRLGKYLVTAPEAEIRFGADGGDESSVTVYTDSDWAGCLKTRKSTSGGVMKFGGGVVKSWATTQGSVALSVGEAEFYSSIKGAAEGIGFCNILRDMGVEAKVVLFLDSTTAQAMSSRSGASKARHIDTRSYWIQDVIKRGVVTVFKVHTDKNPSDLLTKPKSLQDIRYKAGLVGVKIIVEGDRDLEDEY